MIKGQNIWEFFIKDALENPPFFTTAEVTGIENEKIFITYTDKFGKRKTKEINVENATEYNIGDIVDIQICEGAFPSMFVATHKNFLQD